MGSTDLLKAPGAVVMSSFGDFWVEEKAARVRELLKEAEDDHIGEGEGMVRLTGLESTGKTGDEGLAPYDLSLKPIYIGGVRSMTQEAFERTVANHTMPVPAPPATRSDERGPMQPRAIVQGMNVTEECCCGHRLASHDSSSGDVVGGCLIDGCPCELFHTH
jgi:hypothetical protein